MEEIGTPVRFKKSKDGFFLEPCDITEFPDLLIPTKKKRNK